MLKYTLREFRTGGKKSIVNPRSCMVVGHHGCIKKYDSAARSLIVATDLAYSHHYRKLWYTWDCSYFERKIERSMLHEDPILLQYREKLYPHIEGIIRGLSSTSRQLT